MTAAHFYFDSISFSNLREAAQGIIRLFDGEGIELRQSSNYLDGEYYRADINGLTLEVARCDDADAGHYKFWLTVMPASEELTRELQERLANKKIEIAAVVHFGKINQRIVPII